MTKIVVLESARADFQEIQAGFKQSFKDLFAQIQQFPLAGVVPDECVALELVIRQRITEGTRVIYEVRGETIYIRMFLATERDFMTHLVERMLRVLMGHIARSGRGKTRAISQFERESVHPHCRPVVTEVLHISTRS